MISFVTGNIFNSIDDCIVNTVNCEGVMGAGLALQFKQKYPDNFLAYVEACKNGTLDIGKVFFFKEKGKLIANFPTKKLWKNRSEYDYIERGMEALEQGLLERNIRSVSLPPLGCGLGGLNWNVVCKMLQERFQKSPIKYHVYRPMV